MDSFLKKFADTSVLVAAITGYAYFCGASYYIGYLSFFNAGPYVRNYPSEFILMMGYIVVLTLGFVVYFVAQLRSYLPYRRMATRMVERIARLPLGESIIKLGRLYAILLLLLVPVLGASAYGKRIAAHNFHNDCIQGRFVIAQTTGSIEKVMCMLADSSNDFLVFEPGMDEPQPTFIPRSQVLGVTILGRKQISQKSSK